MTETIEARLTQLGIKPLFGEHFPLTEDELAELEQLLGAALPDDYRGFVSKFGCAYFPGVRILVRPVSPPPEDVAEQGGLLHFSAFFGGGSRHHVLLKTFKLLQARMPDTVFPFADDHSGNVFCLGVKGADRDKVYFWSFRYEEDPEDYLDQGLPVPENPWYRGTTLVADSFTDLVNRLERGPSEE